MENGKTLKSVFDFKPLRWAQRPGNINCVGLAVDQNTHKFHVLYWSESGGVYPSGPYSTRALAEMFFEERCAAFASMEITECHQTIKDFLAGMASWEETFNAGLRCLRLSAADDERIDNLEERQAGAEKLPADIEKLPEEERGPARDAAIRDAWNAFKAMHAQDEQYKSTE